MELALAVFLIFLINLPFGYWRAHTRRFSWQWYLAIHLPIPFVILLRVYYEFGWGWKTYLFFVVAFFLGQLTGKLLRRIKRVP